MAATERQPLILRLVAPAARHIKQFVHRIPFWDQYFGFSSVFHVFAPIFFLFPIDFFPLFAYNINVGYSLLFLQRR